MIYNIFFVYAKIFKSLYIRNLIIPDTLLLFFLSIALLFLLILLPKLLEIFEGNIGIKTLLLENKELENPSKNVILSIKIKEDYKDSLIFFSSIAVLSIVMGIPIQVPSFCWLVLRIIYIPFKFLNFNFFQKLTWFLSYLCILWIIILIIFLNRLTMFY